MRTVAGIPWFANAEEEGAFWEEHSPLDYPEYFGASNSLYRPDLGNLPLPFPLIRRNCQEQDPSSPFYPFDESI